MYRKHQFLDMLYWNDNIWKHSIIRTFESVMDEIIDCIVIIEKILIKFHFSLLLFWILDSWFLIFVLFGTFLADIRMRLNKRKPKKKPWHCLFICFRGIHRYPTIKTSIILLVSTVLMKNESKIPSNLKNSSSRKTKNSFWVFF